MEKDQLITERSYEIQINSKETEWLSHIEIPYKNGDDLEILEASIYKNGMEVRKLRKKDIETRNDISDISFFEDRYVKEFDLVWNDFPYRIKYSYKTVTNKFMYVARWFPVRNFNLPVLNAKLKVEIPKDYEVTMEYSKDLSFDSSTNDDIQTYSWKLPKSFKFEKEAFAAPFMELVPNVAVVPKKFHYGENGSFGSWKGMGEWQTALIQDADVLPNYEKYKIDKLLEGITDQKEIINTLYHYLQDNTRYINVAIDVGGLKPYPASFVCEKKYGDCKGLTIYMKAMLNHVGIKSYYTLINAGDNSARINENLPSQQFNHVFLAVPMENDTIWLENTSNYLPPNYMGTFTQNRTALFVDGEQTELIKTKALTLADVLERNKYDFYLDNTGSGTAKITKILRGETFENYRAYDLYFSDEEKAQRLAKDLQVEHFKLKDWKLDKMHRDSTSMTIHLDLDLEKQFTSYGNLKTLKVFPMYFFNLEKPGDRNYGIRINFPVNKLEEITFHFPTENNEIEMPEPVNIVTDYGNYSEVYALKGNLVTVKREFQLFRGDYPVEKYPDFHGFLQGISQAQKNAIIVLN
ncbi:MAG TPA: DUF3857 domain-containing protein [Salinimicrobium sp.]|nr:DUF3857 domain-containing protein [Salinimicrobium sp.]